MPTPQGRITRGTTGVNRLRRVDRWIAASPQAREPGALVVDLGYGAHATTTLELHARLSAGNPTLTTLGIEIDPDRVARAHAELAELREMSAPRRGWASGGLDHVDFALGGFEVPSPRSPTIIRALNVLRQYDEHEVADTWRQLCGRLTPNGLLVEGTSNEVGRVASWVSLDPSGPKRFTIALKLESIGAPEMPTPGIVAARLPKALIHRNVPGERIYDLLRDLDRAWDREAARGGFSALQRWRAALDHLALSWPLRDRQRDRFGELSVPWETVAPLSASSAR